MVLMVWSLESDWRLIWTSGVQPTCYGPLTLLQHGAQPTFVATRSCCFCQDQWCSQHLSSKSMLRIICVATWCTTYMLHIISTFVNMVMLFLPRTKDEASICPQKHVTVSSTLLQRAWWKVGWWTISFQYFCHNVVYLGHETNLNQINFVFTSFALSISLGILEGWQQNLTDLLEKSFDL